MRIAYVCSDAGVPVFGAKGCSVHVQEVIRAWRARGDQVELFAARLGDLMPDDLKDLPLHQLSRPLTADVRERELALLAANEATLFTLSNNGPFDLVYERHALWSYAGTEYARQANIPGVLEVNSPLVREQSQHRQIIAVQAAEAAALRSFHSASTIVAVSESVAQHVRDVVGDDNKVHVVTNGVNPDRFSPRALMASDQAKPFTVGFVGTMKPWHGLDVLMEAFQQVHAAVRSSQLLLVGDGPYRETLEQELISVDPSLRHAVRMVGAVPPHGVPAWISKFDVAVACPPQLDDYYFSPLKLFEYMAAGLPVVASRVGQIPEVVEHGLQGLLCTPGRADEVSRALLKLASSPTMRQRMGRAGRARILERHTWSSVVERIAELAAASKTARTPVGAC
jgi:glycosyltransferase involved in cell wall biosynthesis